jgi:hypothetical protein
VNWLRRNWFRLALLVLLTCLVAELEGIRQQLDPAGYLYLHLREIRDSIDQLRFTIGTKYLGR